jgi:gluconolactonase
VLAPSEIGAAFVYRLDPATGDLAAVACDRVRPNGLAFSPDETVLYVSDTGETHVKDTPRAIHAYAVGADGKSLAHTKAFAVCDSGFFDGFRVDWRGNLWTSSADSVRAYAPDGTLIGRVRVPELVSNLCFGGPRRNRLFITAQTSLYAIYLNAHAANWTPA